MQDEEFRVCGETERRAPEAMLAESVRCGFKDRPRLKSEAVNNEGRQQQLELCKAE